MSKCRKEKNISTVLQIIHDYPYHWYNDLTIVRVIAGTIKVRVWAREDELSKGDFVIFNKGEVHKLSALSANNLVLITHIKRDFCERTCPQYEDSIIICNSSRHWNKNPKKYADLAGRLNLLMRKTIHALDDDREVEHFASTLVEYLCQNFDYISCGDRLERFTTPVIERNRKLYKKIFLSQSELSRATLKEISENLGMSYSYLRSDIIERFGYGFTWLKNTAMIERAAKLILTTDMNLMTIGVQCGFSDPKYMIKYAKIFYGCTPSEFRRKYRHTSIQSRDHYTEIPIEHMLQMNEFLK